MSKAEVLEHVYWVNRCFGFWDVSEQDLGYNSEMDWFSRTGNHSNAPGVYL